MGDTVALGPTERLSQGPLVYTELQQLIAERTIRMHVNVMRGAKLATTNPSSAIGPAGRTKVVSDNSPGLGVRIDLQA